MPRLVVFEGKNKLMDEYVVPAHINDEHSAVQLLERLAWAIEDAHKRTNARARRRRPRARADYLSVDGS